MLVHNRQIIALGKVDHDERSLSGKGTPQEPLGVQNYELLTDQQWVKNYVSAVAGDTIPYSGSDSVKVDEHKISVKDTWLANQLQSYTYNKQTIDSKDTAVRNQFSAYIPRTASAGWDVKPYTGDNVKVQVDPNTHQITIIGEWYVTPDGLAEELLKYYTKSQVDALLANLGGYQVVPLKNGLPDVDEPTNKYIYLTKIDTATGDDKYKEWIWSGAWECIGETSLDLSEYVTETELAEALEPYATKNFVSAGYQEKGNYVSASELEDYYTKTETEGKIAEALEGYITEDEADRKYQPSGDYLSANALDNYYNKGEVDNLLTDYIKTEEADQRYQAIGDYLSANALDPIKTVSGNWDTAYEYIQTYSAGWNEVSAKLDKTDFNAYSADIASALDNRYTKDQTSASDQLSEEFAKYAKTEDLESYAEKTWVEQNFISSAASANWDLQGYSGADGIKIENHIVSFSGDFVDEHELEEALEPYMFTSAAPIVKSTNGSVLVSAYMEDGHQIYDLSATSGAGDITQISAEKGLSAEKDDDGVWHIGVTDYQVSFGRFRLDPYETDFDAIEEPVGDAIIFSADGSNINHVVLKEGIYHIDAQVDVNVGEITNQELGFYPVSVSANIAPWATVTRDVDNSYAHTDTIEVSFDAFVKNETELKINVSNVPENATRYVRNLNITEQISVDAILQGGGGNYTAGDAIGIDPGTGAINVRPGGGLKIDHDNNTLTINCGNGLKINEESLEATLELDEVTEAVVNQVNKIADDLETKVTCDFDYANITDRTDYTQYGSTTGHGVLLGFLFAVPINSKIYLENESEDYETKIAVIASQSYTQKPIILGLFEYDPNYWDETQQQRGRTTALCDTGPVQLTAGGLNEFVVKNIGNKHIGPNGENLATLKSGCMYYAAIYISENPGSGLYLASCPKYNVNFNTKPTLTTDQCNINIDTGNASQASRCNFNEITFKSGTLTNFHELPEVPRMFMQVRNAKKTTVN